MCATAEYLTEVTRLRTAIARIEGCMAKSVTPAGAASLIRSLAATYAELARVHSDHRSRQ